MRSIEPREYDQYPERALLLHRVHTAGLHRDVSQLPAILQAIEEATERSLFYTALHAAAQVGDVGALPTLNQTLPRMEGNDRDFVRNVRARLLATTETQNYSDPNERSRCWLERFFAEIGYTPESLNTAAEANKREMSCSFHADVDGATRALYELADEIYLHRDLALLDEAKRMGVRFDIWKGVHYKVNLAPLSDEERLDWIINTLTVNVKAFTNDSFFLVQLAANQGLPAIHKVVARLREMDRERADYASVLEGKSYYPSYTAMFRILSCLGDKATGRNLSSLAAIEWDTFDAFLALSLQGFYRSALSHSILTHRARVNEGMPIKYRVAY